jgi:hypothetical protein
MKRKFKRFWLRDETRNFLERFLTFPARPVRRVLRFGSPELCESTSKRVSQNEGKDYSFPFFLIKRKEKIKADKKITNCSCKD